MPKPMLHMNTNTNNVTDANINTALILAIKTITILKPTPMLTQKQDFYQYKTNIKYQQ